MDPSQFTHAGDRVFIVKCLNADGTGYDGFVWPKSGLVENKHWSRKADCESGGLFGWPWGLGIGDGKDPNAIHPWLVFSAKPGNVIALGGKCKAVPGEDGDLPTVIYYGDMAGAMRFTMAGRVAYVQSQASGSASSTGFRGSASSTGFSGSASSTGASGSASSTGDIGSASSTGYSGSASSTGDMGSASSTGYRGSASSTGVRGVASICGEFGTIHIGENAIGCSTSNRLYWQAIPGAQLLCKWSEDGKKYKHRTLDAKKLKLSGTVKIEFGKVVKEFNV